MPQIVAYAAQTGTSPLTRFEIPRREPGAHDVEIDILYCGVCHSDLHMARGEWEFAVFPVVPGHEIVGRVTRVGKEVRGFKAGDIAAVGCLVDSCRSCSNCKTGLEQYCAKGWVGTYGSADPKMPGHQTYGGYSKRIVVDDRFVLRVAPKADLAATAPLLCAGITTYSPLRHWNVGKGMKVGVVGLGGLGPAFELRRGHGAGDGRLGVARQRDDAGARTRAD